MSNVFIYHHNDMDGKVSGALCFYYEKNIKNTKGNNIHLFEIDYEYVFKENIKPQDTVYFVDYSFSKECNVDFLKELIRKDVEVVWIDHHKTSKELLNDDHELKTLLELKTNANYVVDISYCATYLVYDYLYKEVNKDETPSYIPMLIKYVDSYDCWKHNMDDTHEFHNGFRYVNLNVSSFFSNIKTNRYNDYVDVNILLPYKYKDDPTKAFVNKCIRTGKIIKKYVDDNNEKECKFAAFEFTIEYFGRELECIALNIHGASQVFGDRIKKYDIVVPFIFKGTQFKYYMFTENEDIDCSAIVKCLDVDNLGAGGHAKAAGFHTKNLILRKDCTIIIKKGLFGKPKLIFK